MCSDLDIWTVESVNEHECAQDGGGGDERWGAHIPKLGEAAERVWARDRGRTEAMSASVLVLGRSSPWKSTSVLRTAEAGGDERVGAHISKLGQTDAMSASVPVFGRSSP